MEKNCPIDPNLQLQEQFNAYKPKKEDDKKNHNKMNSTAKQSHPRMSWTKELHQRFVDVIDSLGPKRSTPKNILELMNVAGLTRKQISDHLHKHRSSSKSNSSNVPPETPSATSSSNGVPSMENEELHMSTTSSQSSLGNKVSNENAVLGSQGDFFEQPGPKSEDFNNVTVEINLGQSPEEPYKYWEGIPDVFEGFDDVNDPGNFQYIEDSFGTVCDWMTDHICQVNPRPSEFDDFNFDELFPNEDHNTSKGADQS